jgi:hypothetical protein
VISAGPRRPDHVGVYEARTPLPWATLVARVYGVLVEILTFAHHYLRRRERFLSEPSRKLAWDFLRYGKGAVSALGAYAASVSQTGHLPTHASSAPHCGPDGSDDKG